MTKHVIHTDAAPAAVGPYSQAIATDTLVYTAGQLGIDPAAGKLHDSLEAQTKQALDNLSAVLQAAGSSLSEVIKTTIFLVDMADFGIVNGIYQTYFDNQPPARSTVAVAALPLGGLVEIEAIGMIG